MSTKNYSLLGMKKALLAVSLSLAGLSGAFAQADQTISGGNTVSSFVCGNKQIYTMGAGGSTPTKMELGVVPNVKTAKQVSSGSGSTFVATDCDGGIWAWGNNKFGQAGVGTSGNTVATPTRILASAGIAATNREAGTNYLTNVAVVYGGNNNSYAILNDGKLTAWGHNSSTGSGGAWDNNNGQLGNGGTADQTSAVYVLKGPAPGTPLTGVTQVYAGDNVTYALVGGVVYSWGNGLLGTLGRNSAGGIQTTADNQSSYAMPVMKADGTPLSNIKKVAAGDVMGMALDNDGYVWTWGNGGWNDATGLGNSQSQLTPSRVVKGTTTGTSNDGTYLLAKDIDGGQGFRYLRHRIMVCGIERVRLSDQTIIDQHNG